MIDNQLGDDPDAALVGLVEKKLEIMQGAIVRMNAVVIGDVDGDGFPDIVTSQEGSGYYYSPALALSSFSTTQVLAYDRNLNPIRSWQLTAGNGCDLFAFPGLAIGNLDHDGCCLVRRRSAVPGGCHYRLGHESFGGCLARRACPVGPAHGYGETQARFHMAAFLAAHPDG